MVFFAWSVSHIATLPFVSSVEFLKLFFLPSFTKMLIEYFNFCHLLMMLKFASSKLGSAGVNNGVSRKKCPGVSGSKFDEPSFMGLIGREFKQLSMQVNTVERFSIENFCTIAIFLNEFLNFLRLP